MADPSVMDPLLEAVDAYRAGVVAFNALPDAVTDADDGAAAQATYQPPLDALSVWEAPALSAKSAYEALTMARDSGDIGFLSDMGEAMFNAALAYLKSIA